MKDFLIRVFIIAPAVLILTILGLTMVIPLLYWMITGECYIEWADDIVYTIKYKTNYTKQDMW